LSCWSSFAALTLPVTRRSEQFIVHDNRPQQRAASDPLLGRRAGVEPITDLNPDVLLISAERIRVALLRELSISPDGGAKIHLFLIRASQVEPRVMIKPAIYAGLWQYRVEIPERIENLKLIRGIVQVLLLEIANRGTATKSAEIPLWLVEGLSLHLSSSVGPNLILGSVPVGSMARSVLQLRAGDPLREPRELLRWNKALTFTELSHPTDEQLASKLKGFQISAQIFFNELIRLPSGRASLFQMLRELPYCWNWETAFFRAYSRHFQRPLDVEKWWSLTLSALTGRGELSVSPIELCLQKLDEILLAPAQISSSSSAVPQRTQATLQQVIADWEFTIQRPVLLQMINQLLVLRYSVQLSELRAAADRWSKEPHNTGELQERELVRRGLVAESEIIKLIDAYRSILHNYLEKRALAGYSPSKRDARVPASRLIQETIRDLDDLLRQREALRRAHVSVAQTAPHP